MRGNRPKGGPKGRARWRAGQALRASRAERTQVHERQKAPSDAAGTQQAGFDGSSRQIRGLQGLELDASALADRGRRGRCGAGRARHARRRARPGCKKAERAAGVATAARSLWPGPHGPDQIPFSIWRYRLPAAPSARAEAGRGVRAAAKAAGRAEWGINAAGFAALCRAPPRSSCKCRRHCPAVAKFRRAAR